MWEPCLSRVTTIITSICEVSTENHCTSYYFHTPMLGETSIENQ
jgi:hypothetical protein